jgi:hypothetical protein
MGIWNELLNKMSEKVLTSPVNINYWHKYKYGSVLEF